MTPTYDELNSAALEIIAWGFLRSEFTQQTYCDWPLERRVDAYLLHHGPAQLLNDGSGYDALLQHIMANIAPAVRTGIIP